MKKRTIKWNNFMFNHFTHDSMSPKAGLYLMFDCETRVDSAAVKINKVFCFS